MLCSHYNITDDISTPVTNCTQRIITFCTHLPQNDHKEHSLNNCYTASGFDFFKRQHYKLQFCQQKFCIHRNSVYDYILAETTLPTFVVPCHLLSTNLTSNATLTTRASTSGTLCSHNCKDTIQFR